MSKEKEMMKLARQRQLTRWDRYGCIGDYHGGAYECMFVSPYTKSAGNLDAKIMVMLQDWSSESSLSGPLSEDSVALGHAPRLPTNKNLKKFLKNVFGLELGDIYATNLFPFVKKEGMSSKIKRTDMVKAAREFGLPQIEIVSPDLVICLGLATFNAIREAKSLPRLRKLAHAIESPFMIGGSTIWCQAHTGAFGQNTRNKGDLQRTTRDWFQMKSEIQF